MGRHTRELKQLIHDLYPAPQRLQILTFAVSTPFSFANMCQLDSQVSGLGLHNINIKKGSSLTGNYHMDDRSIFRPIQYCASWFQVLEKDPSNYATRFMVLMASVHVESLVKRIAGTPRFPLGQALQEMQARRRIPQQTWRMTKTLTGMYNDAKHEMDHDKDTHLFSPEDAILAYFASRKLGELLVLLTHIKTPFPRV